MADTEDPLKPIIEDATALKERIEAFLKVITRSVDAPFKMLRNLIKAIVEGAKDFAERIGKAVVDGLTRYAQELLDELSPVEAEFDKATKLIRKIIDMIRKAKVPAAILSALRGLIQKLHKTVLGLVTRVAGFLSKIDLVTPALKAFDAFRSLLQMMFNWAKTIPAVLASLKAARSVVNTILKALKAEAKAVAKMLKTVSGLKIA